MKRSYQEKPLELKERSDVDPHEAFDPDALGMEDWGEGFHVQAEPVLIERHPDGRIARTTPLSDGYAREKLLRMHEEAQSTAVEAPQRERQRGTQFTQRKMIEMLAGLLMTYYSKFAPGQIPYNPLYDGIPLAESKVGSMILQPNQTGAQLTHVSAGEVHEWLKQVLAARAELVNTRTGRKGWNGDLNDLVVQLKR